MALVDWYDQTQAGALAEAPLGLAGPATLKARLADAANRLTSAAHVVLSRRSKLEVVAAAFLTSVVIAYFECIDHVHMSLVLVYVLPIWITAWYAGVKPTHVLIVMIYPFWLAAIYHRGDHKNLLAFSLNRNILFSMLAFAVAHLRSVSDNLELLAAKRAQALMREMAEREKLEREMLDIVEREKQRIGQELHDGLCQQLAGTAMLSHVHARKMSADSERHDARRIADLVEQSIELARGVAKGLYPVEDSSDGLMQAFEEFTSTTSDLFNVKCGFECHMPVLLDDPATAGHLFRIAQEAVGNAIKHGRATEIQIALTQTEQGLELFVSDNGSGFEQPAQSSGMGLKSMAIRAKLIGGQFHLGASPLGGVEAHCFVPERLDA